MGTLSGHLADTHQGFARRSAGQLSAAASTDGRLGAYVSQAAALSESGARQLDVVAANTRAIAQVAATARSASAQRAVLTALRGQVAQVQDIVSTARKQAGQLATGARGLSYGDVPLSPSPDDQIVGDDRPTHGSVQPVDNRTGPPAPPRPGDPVDPGNRWVDDPQFGHWETVPPAPPYVGATPPPLKNEYRPFPEGSPLKVGPTTGMYTPGKSWIADEDAPAVIGQEGYRFRMAGQEATTTTRMVFTDGQWQQQRWVQNVYEYQRNTSYAAGGDFAGLPPVQNIDHDWKPISLPQIGTLSANNPTTTYYLPDGCGGTVKFDGGVVPAAAGSSQVPIMTRPR